MLNVVAIMFPSPYGDGTRLSIHQKLNLRYRPLAGISCNAITSYARNFTMLSSPCGENPLSHGLRRASSPERGNLVQGKWQLEKLSLRESWRAAPERVLRGEVEIWYKNFDGMAKKFLSPYGDGTLPVNKFHDYFTFSPPYGEAGVQRLRRFCGDKLKFEQLVTTGITTVFPSPCGDKLQDTDSIYCDLPPEFSSPLWDKLKCSGGDVWAAQATFPSPHRDKLK